MSDIRYDQLLNLREQITRIDRSIAETEKLQAETRKFVSESRKLDRDRWLAPALAIVSAIGGLLGAGSFIAALLHSVPHG